MMLNPLGFDSLRVNVPIEVLKPLAMMEEWLVLSWLVGTSWETSTDPVSHLPASCEGLQPDTGGGKFGCLKEKVNLLDV